MQSNNVIEADVAELPIWRIRDFEVEIGAKIKESNLRICVPITCLTSNRILSFTELVLRPQFQPCTQERLEVIFYKQFYYTIGKVV